jgi:DNA-binding NtrC family response regulator
MVRKVWARTPGAAAVAPRAVVLIGDPREWPPDLESLLTAEGYAAGHLPELESVISIVEAVAVRALFVVARPLGASDLLILRRIRQTSPQTGIVVVAKSPTNPDLKLAFESGATAFLSWPASKEAVRQAVDSGSVPAVLGSRLRS